MPMACAKGQFNHAAIDGAALNRAKHFWMNLKLMNYQGLLVGTRIAHVVA
jgi:hypothetical protein